MLVSAHSKVEYPNISSVQLNDEPAVTNISVGARIDSIQRFSKHAVLIIDQEISSYSRVAREFLINISNDTATPDTNVAFVSASTKLNDIQMRCRLIEQLFSNTLFDPEKSLAVSILNLSKQSDQSISIIVEHAHALSLQIKYELCQLVDVANKTQSKIKVALFGLEQAAHEVASNKKIFDNKLSIIDAKSGQLFSLEHASFNKMNSIFTKRILFKFSVIGIIISALIALSWYVLIKTDSFSFSELSTYVENKKVKVPIKQEITSQSALTIPKTTENIAKSTDINAALMSDNRTDFNTKKTKADTADILFALQISEQQDTQALSSTATSPMTDVSIVADKTDIKLTNSFNIEESTIELKPKDSELQIGLDSNYYLNATDGYVVQIVGFKDLKLLNKFVEQYPNEEYFSYQKSLNNQPFFVLTTKIYETKKLANQAIEALPQSIIERGTWLKRLSLVKSEIIKN